MESLGSFLNQKELSRDFCLIGKKRFGVTEGLAFVSLFEPFDVFRKKLSSSMHSLTWARPEQGGRSEATFC